MKCTLQIQCLLVFPPRSREICFKRTLETLQCFSLFTYDFLQYDNARSRSFGTHLRNRKVSMNKCCIETVCSRPLSTSWFIFLSCNFKSWSLWLRWAVANQSTSFSSFWHVIGALDLFRCACSVPLVIFGTANISEAEEGP